MIKQFYHCNCYYTHNIYIKSIDKHFTYINDDQFYRDYNVVFHALGYNISQKQSIIQEINEEIKRRKSIHEKTAARKKYIEENYVPLDSSLYTLNEDFLEPEFIRLVETAKSMNYQQVYEMIETISSEKKIYRIPVFKPDFCQKFLTELNHFQESNMPKEKPNTMNNYGILIDDLGFHDNFTVPLRNKYLNPLAKLLFPEWTGQGLDSHKIFTVSYTCGQDTALGYHYDNSEVTLNVCLGQDFKNSELYFGDMKTVPISQSMCILASHMKGHGIFHQGQEYHGALPITSGERQNLILWMRSSSVRNSQCPMCGLKPSLILSEDYGDGFTKYDKILTCDLI